MAEAQEYRNFVVGKMCFEISEIIRVLQYTTYEEEGGDDPLNDMKKAASLFDSNMGAAMKWVATPTESSGGLGMKESRSMVNDFKVLRFVLILLNRKYGKVSKLEHCGREMNSLGLKLSGKTAQASNMKIMS